MTLLLEKNVINIWGEKGQDWLSKLPSIINALSIYWSLTDIKPVNNMNYNYVALALQNNKIPVVLKISCDEALILNEYNALQHFNGHGAIKVFEINKEYNALLLEQAIPGCLLKENHPLKIEETIKIYGNVVKALAEQPLPKGNYTHVSKWCETIDRITDQRIERKFVDKAKELKSILLASAEHEYLCHGDLHLENIIQHDKNWVSIDPKGIIGEMAFEAAAFDLITQAEIKDNAKIQEKISDRIVKLATILGLDFKRLLAWIFLRVILSAQWFVEDKGDPSNMLVLANYVYPLINQYYGRETNGF